MPEAPPPPTAERRPAWRAAAVAYRQARRDGVSHDAAAAAAEASLREQWPELSAKEASAEVVSAIAYASAHHTTWLWDGVGLDGLVGARQPTSSSGLTTGGG